MVPLRTGIALRVAEAGPPRGAPVLLLHGWGASMYSFRHAFSLLPARGLRVIAADLRGFGLSDKPRARGAYASDGFAADLDALFDALDLERSALVGHSMGGAIALRHALRRPDRVSRLGLISAAGLATPTLLPLMRLEPRWLADHLGRALAPRWLIALVLRHVAYGHAERVTESDVDQYWAPTQLPGWVRAALAALVEFDWRVVTDVEARALTVPTVVILGDDDRLIRNARGRAERLQGGDAMVHTMAAGHCVHEEEPAAVYTILGDFFSS